MINVPFGSNLVFLKLNGKEKNQHRELYQWLQ